MTANGAWAVLLALLVSLAPVGLVLAARSRPCSPPVRAVGLLGTVLVWALLYGLSRALPGASPWMLPPAGMALSAGLCALTEALRRQERRTLERADALRRGQLAELTRVQEEQLRDLRVQLEELRQLRHDLRHYLIAAGPLPVRCAEAAGKRLERPAPPASVVEAVVRHFERGAEALGIETDIRLELGAPGGIAVPDLCLVLGNLLENALEAVDREAGKGPIRVRCASAPGWLSIVVGNPSTGRLRPCRGGYRSSKGESRRGRGLESVRRVAEQYGGGARFTADGVMFKAAVFLVKPSGNEAGQPVQPKGKP